MLCHRCLPGMGFTATKVTPHKGKNGQEKSKKPSTAIDPSKLICFKCGEKGHRSSECAKEKDSLTAEEKAKGKEGS